MGVSLFFQLVGRGKLGNFIAQWVPTWLIIGLYNKVVKQEATTNSTAGKKLGPAAIPTHYSTFGQPRHHKALCVVVAYFQPAGISRAAG